MANSKSSRKECSMNIKNMVTKSGRKTTRFDMSLSVNSNEKKNKKTTPVLKTPVPTKRETTQSDVSFSSKNKNNKTIPVSKTPVLIKRKTTQSDVSFSSENKDKKTTPVAKTPVSTNRITTRSDVSFSSDKKANKTTSVSKTTESKICEKKDSEIKKIQTKNIKNVSQNSSKERLSDFEISDIVNSMDIGQDKFCGDKTLEKPTLRCKKRIDYAQMFRGSSIINQNQPIDKLINISDQEKTVNTKKRHKVYSAIHNSEENIRPSQVYEFNFDAKCESKLKKQFQKEAKVLKKFIKAKVHRKNLVKPRENNKKALIKKPELVISKEVKNTLNKIPEVSKENDSSTNNVNLLQKNPLVQNLIDIAIVHKSFDQNISDSFGNSFIAPQTTPQNPLDNTTVHKSFDPRISDSFGNSFKAPQSTPVIQNPLENATAHKSFDPRISDSFGNSFKAPQSTPIHKSIQSKSTNSDHRQNQSNFEISQIEDDFDDISIHSLTGIGNQSIPWRAEIPKIRRERFFHSKNSSLPSYNQDIIIKPQDIRNLSHANNSNCINSEKKIRQSSMLSFVESSNSIKSKKDTFQKNYGKGSPAPFKDLTNSFESSLSDISIEGKANFEPIDKNKRINFQKAITSSPSVKKNILGENNSSSKVQNISTNTSKGVYDENNKENFYLGNHVNITNNCAIELEKNNSSCDFFGFNSSEQAESRKSKKPMRYPSLKPVITSKVKTILEPLTVHEENIEITNEPSIDIPNEQTENNEENLKSSYQLFDEPRFSNYVRRSYAPPKNKRKRKQILSISYSDSENENELQQECVKKKKKNKRTKKEEEEFNKWAKQFNSMCQDVDKEELVVE